jgi:hypothetical protein
VTALPIRDLAVVVGVGAGQVGVFVHGGWMGARNASIGRRAAVAVGNARARLERECGDEGEQCCNRDESGAA